MSGSFARVHLCASGASGVAVGVRDCMRSAQRERTAGNELTGQEYRQMVASINTGPLPAYRPIVLPNTGTPKSAPAATLRGDTVEFSSRGEALARTTALSGVSLDRIEAIRAEILAGTYETPERIEGVVQHLLDVIA